MRVRRSVEYLSLVLFAEDYSETNLKMNLCEFHIGFWTRVLVVAVWISNFSVSRGKKDLCYVTIFAQSHILHMTVLSKARSPWFLGEPKTWYFINKRILSGTLVFLSHFQIHLSKMVSMNKTNWKGLFWHIGTQKKKGRKKIRALFEKLAFKKLQ